MNVDLAILKAFGSDNSRLREIYCADATLKREKQSGETKEEKTERIAFNRQLERDIQQRAKEQLKDQSRLYEGIRMALRNWQMYAAVDLARDSSVITGTTLPLLLYAQGKINIGKAVKLLGDTCNGEQYIKRDEKGTPEAIDTARFCEMEINIVNSITNRRLAAQKNIFSRLWPHYEYEPRSTGPVAKCRADVMSQRADIMTDQFDLRHHDEQVMADGFYYGHSVDFVRCGWETERQYRRKDYAQAVGENRENVESVIVRQGVSFTNPHPTRVFWDTAEPLASLNSDSGCKWVGYFDVVRFKDIDNDPSYFNKDKVTWNTNGLTTMMFASYIDYFNQYNFVIRPPDAQANNLSLMNDRKSVASTYTSNQGDASVFKTELFERVTPKDIGCGEYPYPVWLRKVLAGDNTVIFAEWLPSLPAAVLSIGESDGRLVSPSMAMRLLGYQQAMTNLTTQLVNLLKIESFKAIGINTDGIPNAEDVKKIEKELESDNWYSSPLVYKYSLGKDAATWGEQAALRNIKEAISISNAASVSNSISVVFEAMVKLVAIVEKQEALSQAEQGQPAPREISATESNNIQTTTTSLYSSISADINKFRNGKKRIIAEAVANCEEGEINCPVKNRYTLKTITAAGFKPVEGEDEDWSGDARRRTVTGSPKMLIHDYIYTTRDGDDRPSNTQAANTLVQLLAQYLAVPSVVQAGGKEKLYEIFNAIFRQSGAGIDLNLTLGEGESNELGESEVESLKKTVDQTIQYLNQMAGALQKNTTDIAQQKQVNDNQEAMLKSLAQLAEQVRTLSQNHENVRKEYQDAKADINKRLIESINYRDAPPSVQKQLELQAGLVPAPDSERVHANGNGKTAKK